MEQAVLRVCHAAGPGSILGRDMFPRWGIFGVFPHLLNKTQESLSPQGPQISFGRHNQPFIFTVLAWMVCIVFHVRIVSEVAPALSW